MAAILYMFIADWSPCFACDDVMFYCTSALLFHSSTPTKTVRYLNISTLNGNELHPLYTSQWYSYHDIWAPKHFYSTYYTQVSINVLE